MKTRVVLVVDDEKNQREMLVGYLSKVGYHAIGCSSGIEAIRAIKDMAVDFVLTDYQMPRESGVELIRKISRLYPDVVCMVLSGKSDFEMAVEIINQAVVHKFIAKPWNDAELLQTIAGALRERDLTLENRSLRVQMKKMMQVVNKIENAHPGITKLEKDLDGAIIID